MQLLWGGQIIAGTVFSQAENILTCVASRQQYQKLRRRAVFQKGNFKKSLKRQFLPMSPTSKASQPSTFDNHLESKSPKPLEKSRQMRDFLSPQTKIMSPTFKKYMVPSEPMRPHFSIKFPQPEIVSCKTIQQQPPQNFVYTPQPTIASFHSLSKTIKINYNSSPITYTSPPKR